MGREFDAARSALLATTVLAGVVVFTRPAGAVPYSMVETLNLGDAPLSAGGLGNAAVQQAGSIALFAGSTNATGSVLITQDAANKTKTTIHAGTSPASGIVVLGTLATMAPNGGTGGNKGTIALQQSGTNVVVGTGATFTKSNTHGTITGATTMAVANNFATAAGSIAADAQTIASATADFSLTNGGTVYAHNRGYSVIDITGQLTQALTLEAGNASDYFFVELENGIGNGGAIVFGTPVAGGTAPLASNVIVNVDGGGTSTINTSTFGSYIDTSGLLKVSGNTTIDGGLLLANKSTSPLELETMSGVVITPDPWNGYVSASAPEPGSWLALASGLLPLGAIRRRRRRVSRST